MRTTIEAAGHADITDPVIVIRIQQAYRPDLSAQALYEVTRGVWVIGPRRSTARYALAVFDRIVRRSTRSMPGTRPVLRHTRRARSRMCSVRVGGSSPGRLRRWRYESGT